MRAVVLPPELAWTLSPVPPEPVVATFSGPPSDEWFPLRNRARRQPPIAVANWSGPLSSIEASARKLLDADRKANHPTLSGAKYAQRFGMLEGQPGDGDDPRGREGAIPLSALGGDDADDEGLNKMDALAGAFTLSIIPGVSGMMHLRSGRYLVDTGWRDRGISSGEQERFFKNAIPAGKCLLWIGDRKDGYGRFSRDDKARPQAHHYAFAHYTGRSLPLSRRLTVVQECGNRGCIAEEHLVAGRKRDNALGRAQGSRHWPRGAYFRPSRTRNTFAPNFPIPTRKGEGHAPSTPSLARRELRSRVVPVL